MHRCCSTDWYRATRRTTTWGRVNGLWAAQDAAGDSLATIGIGLLGKLLSATAGIFVLGATAGILGLAMLGLCKRLRSVPLNDPSLPAA